MSKDDEPVTVGDANPAPTDVGDRPIDTWHEVRSVAFERLGGLACVLNGDGVIIDTNEAWRRFSYLNDGGNDATGPGVNYLTVCDHASAAGVTEATAIAAALREMLAGGRETFQIEYSCPSPIEDRWFRLQAQSAPVADGAGVVIFHVEVTRRRALEDHLAKRAEGDASTGLPDGRSAVRFIEDRIATTETTPGSMWLVYIAIEHLDAVTDQYGYYTSEELLMSVAARTRHASRESDGLYRLDRDKFILACGGAAIDDAALIVGRLRDVLATPFQIGADEIRIDASVGVASSTPASTPDSILKAIDLQIRLERARRPRRSGRPANRTSTAAIVAEIDLAEVDGPGSAAAVLTAVLDASTDGIFTVGRDRKITSWSSGAASLFGHSHDPILGREVCDLFAPGHREEISTAIRTALRGRPLGRVHVTAVRADTTPIDIAMSLSPIRDAGGRISGVAAVTRARKSHVDPCRGLEFDSRELSDSHALAGLGIAEIALETGRARLSDELCHIIGVPIGSVSPGDMRWIHPEDHVATRSALDRLAEGHDDFEQVIRLVRPDGGLRQVVFRPLRNSDPATGTVTVTMYDVTDLVEAQATLRVQTASDELTGLPNRRTLTVELSTLLAEAASAGLHVAVAFADLDQFKVINDTMGHSAGDVALRRVADRLRSGLSEGDTVARFGGDEFVAVRPGINSLEDALEFAELVRSLSSGRIDIGRRQFELSASVGATISEPGDTADTLLRDADTAMHMAKDEGRANVTVFEQSARARTYRRLTIETALRQALPSGELHLEFQPILHLSTMRVAGFEALLRWTHPSFGTIGPDEFIPVAEASGLILPIGEWVLSEAVGQLARWREDPDFDPAIWMAVNVSVQQFGQPAFVHRTVDLIDRSHLPPELVHLEVTESVLMDGVDDSMACVATLRAAGVNVGIDDFGTGFSSLSYLNRMAIDTLKIDRSFVRDIVRNRGDAGIVEAILALAATLDLTVVAEGVETTEQLDLLQELGCTYGQGWLWSRSLRADDALAWVNEFDERAGEEE